MARAPPYGSALNDAGYIPQVGGRVDNAAAILSAVFPIVVVVVVSGVVLLSLLLMLLLLTFRSCDIMVVAVGVEWMCFCGCGFGYGYGCGCGGRCCCCVVHGFNVLVAQMFAQITPPEWRTLKPTTGWGPSRWLSRVYCRRNGG